MFAYCNNSPVLYVDSAGNASHPSMVKTTMAFDGDGRPLTLDEWANIIATQHTVISKRYVTKDGQNYITYDVSVETKHFSKWENDRRDMMDVTECYAKYVYDLVKAEIEADDGSAYWIMSENHIYSEMMAHIEVWFTLGVDSTEVANLNVDESRRHVRFLMYLNGYNGREEVINK